AAEPDTPNARVALASAYRDRGYPDIALEMSRLAAQRFPDSGEVQLALVRALRDLNRRSDAIVGLEAFLTAHPKNPRNSHPGSGFCAMKRDSGRLPRRRTGRPSRSAARPTTCTTISATTC